LQSNQIDVLINNAGVAGRRGMTRDGFELAFGVNYLSHYLLTRKLQGHGVRVVNVSSEAHRSVSSLDLSGVLGRTRSIWGWREYALSKACQIAFTLELAAQGVEAFSVHPGLIATGLWRPVPRPFRWLVVRGMAPPAVGALPVIRAALDRELPSGSYVTPSGVMEPSAVISDQEARTRLWNQSERWVGEYLA
jgi:NAD(P)-dependent dehydrogenase (short-subunit alcohol dehydrogenase family)